MSYRGRCGDSRRRRGGRCRTWDGINSWTRREDPLLEGIEPGEYFYFVHGYAVPTSDVTLAQVEYGEALSAAVRHRNFWGTQFHPERSASAGARLLGNFLRLN